MTPQPPAAPGAAHAAALLAAAFLFGTTFVVVQDAVEEVEPVPFLAVRFAIGTAVLLPLALRRPRSSAPRPPRRALWTAGAVTGVALTAGYLLQTIGLQYTTTQVSAFLTYLLVVFVPVLGSVIRRRLPAGHVVVAVVLAVLGVGLLTGGRVGFGRGEVLTLGCALAYAIHILLVAHWAPRHDLMRLNVLQLGVLAAICAGPGLVLGGYGFPAEVWWAAAYTGVFASALSFALQLFGQRGVDPARAALLLLTEPVFAAVLGHLTGERLGAVAAVGALLILSAIVVTEVIGPLTARSRVGEPEPDAPTDDTPSRVRALGPP